MKAQVLPKTQTTFGHFILTELENPKDSTNLPSNSVAVRTDLVYQMSVEKYQKLNRSKNFNIGIGSVFMAMAAITFSVQIYRGQIGNAGFYWFPLALGTLWLGRGFGEWKILLDMRQGVLMTPVDVEKMDV